MYQIKTEHEKLNGMIDLGRWNSSSRIEESEIYSTYVIEETDRDTISY